MDAMALRAWQRRLRLSNREAAQKLGLSASGYMKQRSGAVPVGAQTAIICDYALAWETWGPDIADAALRLTRKVLHAR
jgi:hypothetical protein